MKKIIIIVLISALMALAGGPAYGATSDAALAQKYVNSHPGTTIEKVITISKGGTRGQVKGTKYVVKYPRKVKKGRRVTVYMIERGGDVVAMVCCGKIK